MCGGFRLITRKQEGEDICMFETLKEFLEDCPMWGSLPLQIDGVSTGKPGVSLLPRGLTHRDIRQDVTGNCTVTDEYRFLLRRIAPEGDNAGWFSDLENWIRTRDALGEAPRLGEEHNRICLEKGRLCSVERVGLAGYEGELSVRFTDHYEGE